MLAGDCALTLFPSRVDEIRQQPFLPNRSILDRVLRNGLLRRAYLERDHQLLRTFLAQYWGTYAATFHEAWNDRFERLFLQHDKVVIDELERLIAEWGEETSLENLYEIGCGGGEVTRYLNERFPELKTIVGLDLGEEQIRKNRERFGESRPQFEAADAVAWIPENAQSNSIFVTNGGVLEYFLESEIDGMFQHIAKQLRPAAVVVIETIGSDHDLENETASLIYGREMAFSHNYPHLLRKNGFEIRHQSERVGEEVDGGGRWIRVLATCR